jgi:Holliday junction resolvase
MATPESKVKKKVYELIDQYGDKAYRITPTTGGYGSSGAPDIVVCFHGRYIGIECKAGKGKPTALQMKNLQNIVKAGGYAYIVNERSIGIFSLILSGILSKPNAPPQPEVSNLTREFED